MDTTPSTPPATPAPAQPAPAAPPPRLRTPDRSAALPPLPLDQLLEPGHPARLVWDFAQGLDLAPLDDAIKSRHGGPGRAAAEPRLLVALWLYATSDSVGSARRLARLCDPAQGSLPYLWLCGGVSLNYHTLADFRVGHAELLDGLLSDGLAVLLHEGLLDLEETAQDSLRVRASAGSSSSRRRASLGQCRRQAEERVRRLRRELEDDPAGPDRRRRAARERAARERADRLGRALEELAQLEQQRGRRQAERGPEADRGGVDEARASSTDPGARVLKMADGGFRPAYDVGLNTTTAGGVVVGVEVSNRGSDSGRVVPMPQQTQGRAGGAPARHLVGGGFGTRGDVEGAARDCPRTTLYAPVKDAKGKERAGQDPYRPRPGDGPAVAGWRVRMGTAEAKAVYKRRSAAELSNAQARDRGLYQVGVRGLAKVRAVVLGFVLVHNRARLWALRAAKAAEAAAGGRARMEGLGGGMRSERGVPGSPGGPGGAPGGPGGGRPRPGGRRGPGQQRVRGRASPHGPGLIHKLSPAEGRSAAERRATIPPGLTDGAFP